ncbi:MAG: hypothetical protein RR744_00150 [Cellulosilyticaceae bacterium]
MKFKDKMIIATIVIGGLQAIYSSNSKEIHRKWHLYTLNRELKDVYSHSRYYEKMSKHGLSIANDKWEELHIKANDIKAEIQFIKNNYQ